MSADLLRKAATRIRNDWPVAEAAPESAMSPETAFHLAVADLLSMARDHAAGRGTACPSCVGQAVAVARAYLHNA